MRAQLVALAFVIGCAVAPAPPDSPTGPGCYPPGGHIDCFGGWACRSSGGVCSIPDAPQYPCPVPNPPVCPCEGFDTTLCALGCRVGASVASGEDPAQLCIENRPRIAGDPCRGIGDCTPGERESLECDLSTMRCAPMLDAGELDVGGADVGG